MFSSQYQKSIFDQPSAYLFDSVSDREYTAETVKKRLDELKELEKRLQVRILVTECLIRDR